MPLVGTAISWPGPSSQSRSGHAGLAPSHDGHKLKRVKHLS